MDDIESHSDGGTTGGKEEGPVMFCQTTAWSDKTTGEGQAPSTPRKRNDKRRLSELMFFRCTPEDKTTIEANAAKVGLEKSSYMRVQSTGKSVMRAYRRIRADWDELRRCMGVINRAGNVVNQLVVVFRRMDVRHELANTALSELITASRVIVQVLKNL